MTFWLALRDPRGPEEVAIARRVQAATYAVGARRAACPYLSVEYQADTETGREVMERLAETCSTALYNRFVLHKQAEAMRRAGCAGLEGGGSGGDTNTEHAEAADEDGSSSSICHYCIVIGWDTFSVWLIQPGAVAGAASTTTNATNLNPITRNKAPNERELAAAATTRSASTQISKSGGTSSRASQKRPQEPLPSQTASLPPAHRTAADTTDNAAGGLAGSQTKWPGALITRLTGAGIDDMSRDLLPQWIEHIHRWGTSAYADAVVRDVNCGRKPLGGGGGGHIDPAAMHHGAGSLAALGQDERQAWAWA